MWNLPPLFLPPFILKCQGNCPQTLAFTTPEMKEQRDRVENFPSLFLILEVRQRKQIAPEEQEIVRTGKGMIVQGGSMRKGPSLRTKERQVGVEGRQEEVRSQQFCILGIWGLTAPRWQNEIKAWQCVPYAHRSRVIVPPWPTVME